jgi:hypothetical protein
MVSLNGSKERNPMKSQYEIPHMWCAIGGSEGNELESIVAPGLVPNHNETWLTAPIVDAI